MNRISSSLDPTALLTIYKATILPILDYGLYDMGILFQGELWFFRPNTKQSYENYLKGKLPDLFTNDERQTNAI